MAMDTEVMVDTLAEAMDTTEERGLLMLMPMLMPTMAIPMPMVMLLPTMDMLLMVTTLARGLLMLSLPMAMDTEVMVDTEATVDTEDTIMVKFFQHLLFVRVLDSDSSFCKKLKK